MKCVFDTTINLKQLVAASGEKLMLPVNGKPMLEQHFSSMSKAGVTSLFVLLEHDSSMRAAIAREALKFGFNPTFLEVDERKVATRTSLMQAEPYLKESFIYWPANRLISDELAQQLVEEPISSHQVLSLVYSDSSHPHCDKSNVFRVSYQPQEQVRVANSEQKSATGYDIGIYKCGTIIFKLIEKVAANRPLSWNRVQSALTRAGRSKVIATTSQHWALIETTKDIEVLEGLLASHTLDQANLNPIDKSALYGAYCAILPSLMKVKLLKEQGTMLWLLLVLIGALLMTVGNWLIILLGSVAVAGVIVTYPVIDFISDKQPLTQLLRGKTLAVYRMVMVIILSTLSAMQFGVGIWVLIPIIVLSAEAFFLYQPEPIADEKAERISNSHLIHGVWLLLSIFFFIPTLMLTVFAVLPFSIGLTKGLQKYKTYQRDKV
ncbi:hypothetical protein [Pleionea litopenaei]|uniref:Uncharacterized protein n=1 Tax=Pleionea litopenaei TaxID=3070815 RepID=A0AA51RTG0_9GAMM|nr:hypothetical protein [Pleionea sp. HL-JVS1]WMS87381.1 hypothetical protein Q9312_00275 [Pleionea sp. HL-JVS1]